MNENYGHAGRKLPSTSGTKRGGRKHEGRDRNLPAGDDDITPVPQEPKGQPCRKHHQHETPLESFWNCSWDRATVHLADARATARLSAPDLQHAGD